MLSRPFVHHSNLLFRGITLVLFVQFLMGCGKSATPAEEGDGTLQFWLSDPQSTARFAKQEGGVNTGRISSFQDISLDSGVTYQSMDGFGFALTGGSALHINNMSAGARETLLKNLFGTDGNQIGVSYLRVSIGASDLDEAVFSYNDLPAGQSDLNMDQFSLDPDRRYLIPVLKEILLINPEIKILGSPWSPPTWMKTNNSSIGGSLRPQYYDTYALYFVKYLQGMAAEGIPIDAITVQNEPLHGGNNPSMVMQASEQAAFIKNSLGPALRGAGLQTKIIVWDHNADNPDYPIEVLNDPAARGYVDGSAFHLYGGDISALSTVHSAHPDKNLYFTEQWIGAPGNFPNDLRWHVRELIIGASRNWAKAVIEWNLAADSNQDPHTPGGCTECLGAVTIEGDNVIRNPAYYIIAHAAKFVRPGSRRISSTSNGDLPNVAFLTPDGAAVIIVLNNGGSPASFNIVMGNKAIHSQLNAGAVGTYVWR